MDDKLKPSSISSVNVTFPNSVKKGDIILLRSDDRDDVVFSYIPPLTNKENMPTDDEALMDKQE